MKIFLTLLLGLLLSSCASLQFESPKLSVVSVGMVSADVFSQQFRIRLHVHNPNTIELPIKGIEYTLFLQGDRFALHVELLLPLGEARHEERLQ